MLCRRVTHESIPDSPRPESPKSPEPEPESARQPLIDEAAFKTPQRTPVRPQQGQLQ